MLAIPVIIYVILIIFGILNIILFFKLWGATNDIRKIRNAICGSLPGSNKDNAAINQAPSATRTGTTQAVFSVGDRVTAKDNYGEILYIDRINNVGECVCKRIIDGRIVGAFKGNQLVRA